MSCIKIRSVSDLAQFAEEIDLSLINNENPWDLEDCAYLNNCELAPVWLRLLANGRYEIEDGNHRVSRAQLLGEETILAFRRDLSDDELDAIQDYFNHEM
jgi:ParB-like nuclease domain